MIALLKVEVGNQPKRSGGPFASFMVESVESTVINPVLATLFDFFKVRFVETGKGRLAGFEAKAIGRRSSDELAGLGVGVVLSQSISWVRCSGEIFSANKFGRGFVIMI